MCYGYPRASLREELTPEQEKAYSKANTIFYGVVVGVFAETLQDTYLHYRTAK
jgi:hypothetical protein